MGHSDLDVLEMVSKWSELDAKLVQRGCFLAWNIWFERNKFVFDNKCVPLEVLVQRVLRQVDDHNLYSQHIYAGSKRLGVLSADKWLAPVSGIVKINTDASLCEEGQVGLGAIARDNVGRVLFAVVRRQRAWWPPDVAEAKAIHLAMIWAKKQGFREVIIESDAQVIVSRLSKSAIYFSDLDAILGDIISLCTDFHAISFSHVKRGGNYAADHLAKIVPFGNEQCWINHCPSTVSPYVLMDTLSLD
ncbi:uncharacterized protein LOC104900678 [Beta vulgaris subsp. vulgaris]|uniref:uncharacterized protein LOC104900678 n=1 Tax=Beta vulgaris subsp. vulgaris TaxID=3555 RepID=UPI0020372ECC|nr:uncharacterized protein LOC104900678 [Beta vulgaris subsp. vulgaris]